MAQLDDDAALRTALEQGRPVLPDPDFLRRHRVPHEARAGEDVLARGTPVRGAPPPHAILFSTANTTRYAIFLDASAPSRKPSLPSGKIDGRSEDGRQEAEPGLSLSAPTEGTDIIDDSPPSPSIEGEVEDDSGNTTVSTVTNSDGCGLRENLRRRLQNSRGRRTRMPSTSASTRRGKSSTRFGAPDTSKFLSAQLKEPLTYVLPL